MFARETPHATKYIGGCRTRNEASHTVRDQIVKFNLHGNTPVLFVGTSHCLSVHGVVIIRCPRSSRSIRSNVAVAYRYASGAGVAGGRRQRRGRVRRGIGGYWSGWVICLRVRRSQGARIRWSMTPKLPK